MRSFFDTSALVPVFMDEHPHHEPSLARFLRAEKKTASCAAHSLAEVYSTLTRPGQTSGQRRGSDAGARKPGPTPDLSVLSSGRILGCNRYFRGGRNRGRNYLRCVARQVRLESESRHYLHVGPGTLPAVRTRSCQSPANAIKADHSSSFLSRSEFVMTETELKLIAAAARMGLSRIPKNGYSTPAATGTPIEL